MIIIHTHKHTLTDAHRRAHTHIHTQTQSHKHTRTYTHTSTHKLLTFFLLAFLLQHYIDIVAHSKAAEVYMLTIFELHNIEVRWYCGKLLVYVRLALLFVGASVPVCVHVRAWVGFVYFVAVLFYLTLLTPHVGYNVSAFVRSGCGKCGSAASENHFRNFITCIWCYALCSIKLNIIGSKKEDERERAWWRRMTLSLRLQAMFVLFFSPQVRTFVFSI